MSAAAFRSLARHRSMAVVASVPGKRLFVQWAVQINTTRSVLIARDFDFQFTSPKVRLCCYCCFSLAYLGRTARLCDDNECIRSRRMPAIALASRWASRSRRFHRTWCSSSNFPRERKRRPKIYTLGVCVCVAIIIKHTNTAMRICENSQSKQTT